MSEKREATREDARRILRDGILDMNVTRLIQMAQFGLAGNIKLRNKIMLADNAFNHIDFHEENGCITFSVVKTNADYCYGSISFLVDAIVDISGCDDKDNPDEYLNVNIILQGDTTIVLKIAY